MNREQIIKNYLEKLSKSKFRSSFHLNKKLKDYTKDVGYKKIQSDTYEIINSRLNKEVIENDGKQTPMRQVHPVFIAQHATATCCRGCLEKWYKIPKGRLLKKEEINFIVAIILKWIENEL